MIEHYVQSNETHGLETFIDHEIFRKSYHELLRSLIEQPGAVQAFAKVGNNTELETQLREKVKSFLHLQF